MNQRTAKLIQDCQNAGGLAGPSAHQCRVAIVRTLTGRRVLSKDCGYHAAWKAIHADLDTPLGSDATMKAWALQRVMEIAAKGTP